ncbi:MAG: molybdate ABC transporter substrate-binding protein [Marmoricola sp.]
MKRTGCMLGAVGLAAATLTGCGTCPQCGDISDKQTLTVLAASSLTETFDQLATTFESQHKGVTVKLVYDSSATLAQMAEQDAPGDVLATADKLTMDDAEAKKGTGSTPEEFATNVVKLAVPSTNPKKIASFADLQKSPVDYVVCVKTAPCGAASKALLAQNKITHKPVSEEVDVKSVLAKVESNDADAGLVYQTDVTAAGAKVKGFTVPGASANPNTYWVALTSNARSTSLAKSWITLMMSADGQKVLTDAGFGKP